MAINQPTIASMCGDKCFLNLIQNRGDNRLWLRFRNYTTIFVLCVDQGCQAYGPRVKTGPLRGWIRPAGWFRKEKTSFAW